MTEYLPLGSVITLKNGNKKLMIVGRAQVHVSSGKKFDYSSCLWPEGMIDSKSFYLFNQEDIDKIFYIGMQNEEEFQFRWVIEKKVQEAAN